MIARLLPLLLIALPVPVHAVTPLVCLFRPVCAGDACDRASFTVEIAPIDHEPGLWVVSDAEQVPVADVTPEGSDTLSFVSRDPASRILITVFPSGGAIHSRHILRSGQGPVALTAFGQCEVL